MAKESTWQLNANKVQTLSLLPEADKFERLFNDSRGLGNSMLLVNAVHQFGGTVVYGREEQVDVARDHAIQAGRPVNIVRLGAGTKGPVAIDMSVAAELMRESQRLAAAARELLEYGRQKGVWV